jgi:hypothetical protein
MKTKTFAILLLLPALLLSACGRLNQDDAGSGGSGSSGGTGSSGGIDHPTGANDLVLRMATGGGFVTLETNLRAIPNVSLYGDGRLITQGPVIEIYPGPAMPNLQVAQLTEEGVQAILAEAEKAGLLGKDATYDYPCVADLPTTTFTVNANGATHTVSAYALGFETGTTGATGGCGDASIDTEARAQLAAFSAKLGDLRSWLPEGSIGDDQSYTPTELRIYVRPYIDNPELEQQPTEWPLSTPLASFGTADKNLDETRCGVVSGDDLETLLPLANAANELTPWTSDAKDYALIFRPLLPDEHGC